MVAIGAYVKHLKIGEHLSTLPVTGCGHCTASKLGATTLGATPEQPKYLVDVNTLKHQPAKTLQLNEVGDCTRSLDQPIAFPPYGQSRDLGSFIVIEGFTNLTVAAGMLHFAFRRSQNVHWQAPGIEKTEQRLHALGVHTYLLDGDNFQHGRNRDLGFTSADRLVNIRRIGEVSRLMVDARLMVISAFISSFRAECELARSLVAQDEFIEVYADMPLPVVEARDPKGLYKKKTPARETEEFHGNRSPLRDTGNTPRSTSKPNS